MIEVSVKLLSAISPTRDAELARVLITNEATSTNGRRGNYLVRVLRGRSKEALDKLSVQRTAMVYDHRRLDEHVLNLVAKALEEAGYGNKDVSASARRRLSGGNGSAGRRVQAGSTTD